MTAKKRRTQPFFFYSAFCILHSALILVPPCRAQMSQAPGGFEQTPTPYDQRTDAFRRLLFGLGFQPLGGFGDLGFPPNESLLIVLGNPKCLSARNFPEGLHSFVEQGGAVLIATDMKIVGEAAENLKKLAGVIVTGEKLVVRNTDILDICYLNSKYCPYIEPLDESKFLGALTEVIGLGSKPNLFRRHFNSDPKQLQVATNAPSYLKLSGWQLPFGTIHELAQLPRVCQDEKSNKNLVTDENGPLFAVGGTIGKGRVLILADHSIFINRMMLTKDNGNLEFAVNCLHWLRGGISSPMEGLRALASGAKSLEQLAGQRNKVLFWDDVGIQKSFDVPLKMVPMRPSLPPEPAIVAAIDKTIARLEESDAFNQALVQQIDELPGGRQRLLRTATYLLTFAALFLLGYRFLWRTRHRPEWAVPLLSTALREHEPKAALLDQRRRALLRSGNVWEMGHRLARECFESAGVPLTSAVPPRVVTAQSGRWQRWRLNRRVARLWRLARGDAPKPLSPPALRRRLCEIEELKTALANGTIELTGERPA